MNKDKMRFNKAIEQLPKVNHDSLSFMLNIIDKKIALIEKKHIDYPSELELKDNQILNKLGEDLFVFRDLIVYGWYAKHNKGGKI